MFDNVKTPNKWGQNRVAGYYLPREPPEKSAAGKEDPERLRDPIPEEGGGDTREVLPCSELGFRDEFEGGGEDSGP